jgi:hypothetical protein
MHDTAVCEELEHLHGILLPVLLACSMPSVLNFVNPKTLKCSSKLMYFTTNHIETLKILPDEVLQPLKLAPSL